MRTAACLWMHWTVASLSTRCLQIYSAKTKHMNMLMLLPNSLRVVKPQTINKSYHNKTNYKNIYNIAYYCVMDTYYIHLHCVSDRPAGVLQALDGHCQKCARTHLFPFFAPQNSWCMRSHNESILPKEK